MFDSILSKELIFIDQIKPYTQVKSLMIRVRKELI
jgi:hypothetical protein